MNMDYRHHILIVEDDLKIAALLADYFEAAGYRISRLADGRSAVDAVRAGGVDLVILDLMLPELDGIGVCRAVREFSQVPIIMLTARVDEIDRLLGLESGADDYVCKPFSPREVVARARVHLRRTAGAQLAAALSTAPAPTFSVDRQGMRILHNGAALPLTPVEFRLLAELVEYPSRVYTRQQLLDFAHEDQRDTNDRTVDSHIKNIRRKLAAVLPDADCLQSVYGVGYRFELPVR
ncbi:MAG: response regulator [Paucibacter sp.]|nr:response regulator [Roseateles sp.]